MLKLIHPFTMMVSGPTQSGKTIFVLKLIDNASTLVEPAPKRIIYCYTEYQADKFDYCAARGVEFFKGMPSLEMFDGRENTMIILDDLMEEIDENASKLFTRVSHHRDLSVVLLTQNMFVKKPTRTHHKSQFALHRDIQES
jgi:hypothetical protein